MISQDPRDDLQNWAIPDEDNKQKKLNFKQEKSNNGTFQKLKGHNKSGGGDWKSLFREVIKTDNGLKSIASTMATEEQKNQALISALSTSNS